MDDDDDSEPRFICPITAYPCEGDLCQGTVKLRILRQEQIAQSANGSDEFTDNRSNHGQRHRDFCAGEYERQRRRKLNRYSFPPLGVAFVSNWTSMIAMSESNVEIDTDIGTEAWQKSTQRSTRCLIGGDGDEAFAKAPGRSHCGRVRRPGLRSAHRFTSGSG